LIDDELRLSSLRIAPDARAALTALLGGDRQASRNELKKLALYAHGEREVTLDDVVAVVADASELKIDPIVDGAFAGKPDLVEAEFAKAMTSGYNPGVIISAAQRQAAWLINPLRGRGRHAAVDVARQPDSAPAIREKEMSRPRCAISMRRVSSIVDQPATGALTQQPALASGRQRALLSIAEPKRG
jgi:DNA polymerase-3 subunit delta